MQNLVLLIVLVLGAGAGYFVGSWSGRDAKQALAKVEEATKLSKAEYDKESGALKAQLASLTADFERDKQALNSAHDKQTSELNSIIAGSKSKVAELDKARSNTQSEIQRLKAALANAATPQEKQQIQSAIQKEEKVQDQQTTRIAGLQCLETPVPDEVLASWRGSVP